MILNIFEIWDKTGRQTPFAVRRDHWTEDYYAIVDRIECDKMPYGKAFGYITFRGEPCDRFDYDKDWLAEKLIPCCGCYQWSLAENVEVSKGKTIDSQKKKSTMDAYSLNTAFNFGKHKGETVEAVFRQEPRYILWAVVHAEKFCLTEETFDSLQTINTDFKFIPEVRKHNAQKLKRD